MLRRFRKTVRAKATVMAVAAYAFCVLAPNVALALTNAKGAMHCLTEPSNLSHVHAAETPKAHTHTDGTSHVHSAAIADPSSHGDENSNHGDPGNVKEANCCGLFCVTAMAHEGVAVLSAPPPSGFGPLMPEPKRAALAPLRIDQPPIG